MQNLPRYIHYFVFLIIIFMTSLAYYPGLSGDYEFDDGANILGNNAIHIQKLSLTHLQQAAFSDDAGPLKRPISMLSFALNYYATGPNPYYFKLTNLVIHLLTGVSILALSYLLLIAYRKNIEPKLSIEHVKWVSLAIAAAWLLHPLNLTSVLYVVQRMTALSALFTILGLVFYVWGRLRLSELKKGGIFLILSGLVVFGSLAALSKENGLLLPFFALTIEICFFRFNVAKNNHRLFLYIFYAFVVVLPAILLTGYFILHPEWFEQKYALRDFSLLERIMTEPRVLWFYLRLMVLPNISLMGLYHDDIALSTGILNPPSTLFSILGLAGLGIVTLYSVKRAPILAFGLLWFFIGHSMESTVIPLEIAHEHRNYLPIYGVIFSLFYYLLYPYKLAKSFTLRKIFAISLVLLLGVTTTARAKQWGNLVEHSATEVTNHPDSGRANYQMGRIYFLLYAKDPKQQYYEKSKFYFKRASLLRPEDAGGLVALIQLSYKAGTIPEVAWVNDLKKLLATSKSIITNTTYLKTLTDCQAESLCKLPDRDVLQILYAQLDNPRIPPEQAAETLSFAGAYSANKIGDLQAAGIFLKAAVKAVPDDGNFRLNLASWYIATKQFDLAKEEIQKAQSLDKLGEVASRIEKAKRLLPDSERGS